MGGRAVAAKRLQKASAAKVLRLLKVSSESVFSQAFDPGESVFRKRLQSGIFPGKASSESVFSREYGVSFGLEDAFGESVFRESVFRKRLQAGKRLQGESGVRPPCVFRKCLQRRKRLHRERSVIRKASSGGVRLHFLDERKASSESVFRISQIDTPIQRHQCIYIYIYISAIVLATLRRVLLSPKDPKSQAPTE